jgi:hypothetical protein
MGTDWKRLFEYDAAEGVLVWRKRPRSDFKTNRSHTFWNNHFPGRRAGTVEKRDGYTDIVVTTLGVVQRFKAHRIIYEMHHGPIPEGMQIDHRDMDTGNNRVQNLRLATNSQNNQNKKAPRNSKTGVKGVRFRGEKKFRSAPWYADIRVNGRLVYIGSYKTLEEAAAARAEASDRFHSEFACK